MGSAKPNIAQSHLSHPDADKKSIKNFLKKFFKDTKKDKVVKEIKPEPIPQQKHTTVSTLIENFKKIDLEKHKDDSDEDEFKNFERIIIHGDQRTERLDSDVSADSGFAETSKDFTKTDSVEEFDKIDDKNTGHKNHEDFRKRLSEEKDLKEDLVEQFDKLKVDEKCGHRGNECLRKEVDEERAVIKEVDGQEQVEDSGEEEKKDDKKKKVHTLFVSRGPYPKNTSYPSVQPYTLGQNNERRQIYQVNRETLSGGQVIVNATQNLTFEIHQALTEIDKNVQHYSEISQNEQDATWQLAQEFVEENDLTQDPNETDIILSMLSQIPGIDNIENMLQNDTAEYIPNFVSDTVPTISVQYDESHQYNNVVDMTNVFPTPPRSENAFSPMSDSQSLYPTTDYTLSPQTSSPISNVDYEKYQEIIHYDDFPNSLVETIDKEKESADGKARERQNSTSSMTMKQFKDLQKEISSQFSKMECCQINRKPCKEVFEEHMKKLKMEERRSLCLKVANLELKSAYGVLQHILLSLSQAADSEDLQLVLFSLICDRVLATEPALFTGDFGLNLIKSAVLRCWQRPILTRYLVQCVRDALKTVKIDREFVFHEIDDLGDNLITACARAGDSRANVLAELLAKPGDTPLFDVQHANSEGYSPLHVACKEHSAASPRLHVVHILLEHARADLWKGDIKGGETALHLAVNSGGCDLRLVLTLFRHLDRKVWKQLAHTQNRSSMTSLEYARLASKSSTRVNYPQEVLEFLKKCR